MKLSVVVPSRNQGRFIGAALESVISQYKDGNLEILVRDCMSVDETAEVLHAYRDLSFVNIRSEWDGGQADAIAKGFEKSTGDILCWLNSDDLLHHGSVDLVLEAFSNSPSADVVFGEAQFIDEDGNPVGSFPTAKPTLSNLRDRCVLSQPSVFFRRDAYDAVGGINIDRMFCMDYELWTRFALQQHTFKYVPQVLSRTRLHEDTKTANGGLPFISEILQMQQELLGSESPVWKIYALAREPGLRTIRPKTLRFIIAAASQVRTQPDAFPVLFRALNERIGALVSAKLRSA